MLVVVFWSPSIVHRVQRKVTRYMQVHTYTMVNYKIGTCICLVTYRCTLVVYLEIAWEQGSEGKTCRVTEHMQRT